MTLAAVGAVLLLLFALLSRTSDPDTAARNRSKFDAALAQETSAAQRALLNVARPLAGLRVVNPDDESDLYRTLRLKLVSGRLYGGSTEVFLATQAACLFVAAAAFSIALFAPLPDRMSIGVVTAGGVFIAAWPYSRVRDAYNARCSAVDSSLPEFAELLLMPLQSGFGIMAALDFTSRRLTGPVAEEVMVLTRAFNTRSRTEVEAFKDAAENLGTPAARSFFAALSSAHVEGVGVTATIASQAAALRKADYEKLRERIKKVPNRIAIIIGLHLIPSLFILALFPAFAALGQM